MSRFPARANAFRVRSASCGVILGALIGRLLLVAVSVWQFFLPIIAFTCAKQILNRNGRAEAGLFDLQFFGKCPG